MGFLDWFKSSAPDESWHQMQSEADFEQAVERSQDKVVIIFKHSTRCGTSHHVLQDLLQDYKESPENTEVFYLDLITYREVSNLIAERLKVPHQSPQMIVIKNGEVVHHASHHAVKWDDVRNVVKV
jgi:bacillithiol system protein YtxJ